MNPSKDPEEKNLDIDERRKKLDVEKKEKQHCDGQNGIDGSNSIPTIPLRFKIRTEKYGFMFIECLNIYVLEWIVERNVKPECWQLNAE